MTTDDGARVARLVQDVVSIDLNEPFTISSGSQSSARIAVVEVTLRDGTVGLGEAAPLAAYDGETLEVASEALSAAASDIIGLDVTRFRHCGSVLRAVATRSRAVRCALETAMLDALCRRQGLSLYQWFGGHGPARMETDVTVPIGSIERAAEAAEAWFQRGFRALKIKVGGADDLERVLAVHQRAPEARLLLDANAGLTGRQALELVGALRDRGVELALFEQPLAASDWDGLAKLMDAGVRVALDETIASAADVLEAFRRLGSNLVVNVKLMKFGILEALDVVAVAKAGGASLMIGGMLESSLAMTTSACFALGLGGFEFMDLDTHLFLEGSPFRGGLEMEGAELSVERVASGHGVSRSRQG